MPNFNDAPLQPETIARLALEAELARQAMASKPAACDAAGAEAPLGKTRQRSYHQVKSWQDVKPYIGDIARLILGPENRDLSTREQLRFGTNGSVSVEVAGDKAGSWFDHEASTGGGPLQLLTIKANMTPWAAQDWLRDSLGIEIKSEHGSKRRVVCEYIYTDEAGTPLSKKVRVEPKDFYQHRADGNGGWIGGKGCMTDVRRVVYHLDEISAAPRDELIYWTEGEKDADNTRRLGLLAACNPEGGSKTKTGKPAKWRPEYGEQMRGRRVAVFPDNDEVGRQHAHTVATQLVKVGCEVRIVDLPGLPPKGDISDWIAAGGTREDLEALVAAAPTLDPLRHAPLQGRELEITSPARTQADVVELINTLNPQGRGSEGQLSTITIALQGIASLRLDPVTEEVLLRQIKSLAGITLKAVRDQLTALKRAIGIRPVATPATTAICRRYVFIKAINAFWDRDSRTMFSLDAVRNAHWHEMPPKDGGGDGGGGGDRPVWPGAAPRAEDDSAAGGSDEPIDPIDVLIKGTLGAACDKVDVISFVPGENEIFQEDESVALNIWTKPDIVPVDGDATPFIDHLDYVLDGDLQLVAYVLDFMAHLVQRPAVKVKVTVLIIGDPGIGKSMIGEMLCTLVGERNTTAVEESDLISPFNEWMDGVQLVLVNELMTVDRRAAMTRLKSYITDPWLRINRKNVPTYRYRNRANFLMFSNYEDAAKIEKGDRRYLIWISKAKPREKSYYADLRGWFDRGGAEHLLHFLMSRDLSRFDPHAAPPETTAKRQVIDDSREPIMAYLEDAFESGAPPFRHDLVAANHIIDYLADSRKMRVTHKQVTVFLRQIGGVPLGQKRIGEASRASVWAIRNAPEWIGADEGNLAKAWRGMEAPALTDTERKLLLLQR